MLFYHRRPSVTTKDWHSYGHRPSSILGKPLSIFFESKYVQQLIPKWSPDACTLHGTLRFIDDLCTINNDGEFSSSYKYIYPKQLELKLEHQEEHATFLDLDITIENNIFVYKLFDKRGKFPFIVLRMTLCRVIFHHHYSMAQFF